MLPSPSPLAIGSRSERYASRGESGLGRATAKCEVEKNKEGERLDAPLLVRVITASSIADRCSVAVALEGQAVCFAHAVEDGLERREHRCRESEDGPDGHRDRSPRALRPVRHGQPGDESPDELTTLGKETASGRVEDLEWDLEVTRHELARRRVTPRGVADGASLRPDAKMANRLDGSLA